MHIFNIYKYIYVNIYIVLRVCLYNVYQYLVPHKALAEVSKVGRYRGGELLWCMDGGANPLVDRKVVRVVFLGVAAMVAVVTSPTTAGCSVV